MSAQFMARQCITIVLLPTRNSLLQRRTAENLIPCLWFIIFLLSCHVVGAWQSILTETSSNSDIEVAQPICDNNV